VSAPRLPPDRTLDLGSGVIAVVAENPGPLTLDGTRTYLVGGSRPIVLDPGPLDPAHLARIDAALGGRTPGAVCLTHAHADHAEAAAATADLWSAPLTASAATLARLEQRGTALADGDRLPLGEGWLRVIASPGHSGDHVCFLVEESRDLFTGDLVLGEGSSMVAHPDGSVSAYVASLRRLAEFEPARLLPGHGPPVRDAVAKLESYAAHRLERSEQVRQALADGVRSVAELREVVYGDLPPGVGRAADLSLLAHLAHLRELGLEVPRLSGEGPDPAAERRPPGGA